MSKPIISSDSISRVLNISFAHYLTKESTIEDIKGLQSFLYSKKWNMSRSDKRTFVFSFKQERSSSHTLLFLEPFNPKRARLLGGVLFGEMKFVFSFFFK